MESPWQYSTVHNSACKVIEEQTLWEQTVCRVWLPNSDSVIRVPASDLSPLASRPSSLTTKHIAYVAAAAKVAEVLEGGSHAFGSASDGHVLLAPMESNVIPLPHQINALSRAISGDRVRYLLADEVGLGKSDAFHRLMSLLDDDAFPDMESVTRDRVAPYVIRTEKRKAIDADGKPLFKPRRTQMVPVAWESRHHLQQLLYEAVTDYVREGYNQALREKKRPIGFLMILMQRLVVSSTWAIRTTLERRLAVLMEGEQQVSLRLAELENDEEFSDTFDEFYDMVGQELLDELLKSHVSALQSEGSYVETLLDAARKCEQAGPDAKAEALIEWVYKLQSEENEPDLKALIFTEFVSTQQMLKEFLEARGISVVTLNGSMDMDERQRAQDSFRGHTRVLVSTDAGGEGLNLQFCHVVINYDIPWNPMRLEQRIGRVDRIGQLKTVQAINFVFEDSVEFRVREVLEQKLAVIFHEFGIDKTGDVLDSAQAGELFEGVFASAILNPDGIESSVDHTVSRIRDEIRQVRETSAIYGISDEPDLQTAERLRTHPLPHWMERMTVGYLNSHGGAAIRKRSWWDLNWPDGEMNCTLHDRSCRRSGRYCCCASSREALNE